MRKLRVLVLFFAVSLVAIHGSAQLSSDKNEILKMRVQEMVGQMTDNISFMADKKKDYDTRMFYRQVALKLFIGEGGPYQYMGEQRKGVIMETTSLYRSRPTRRLMRDYFEGLVNLKYSQVVIESTQTYDIEVSDLKKVPGEDNLYVCTACFEQLFMGYRDGRVVYGDRTRKEVTAYVRMEEVYNDYEFIVMLGDVTAKETKRI